MPTGLTVGSGERDAQRRAKQRRDAPAFPVAFVRCDVADQGSLALIEDLMEDGAAKRELGRRAAATPDRADRQVTVGLDGDDHAALGVREELHEASERSTHDLIELATAPERAIDVEHGPERLGGAPGACRQVVRAEIAERLEHGRPVVGLHGHDHRLTAKDRLVIPDPDPVAVAEPNRPRFQQPATVQVGRLIPARVDEVVGAVSVPFDPGMVARDAGVFEPDVDGSVPSDLDPVIPDRDTPPRLAVGDELQPGAERVAMVHRESPRAVWTDDHRAGVERTSRYSLFFYALNHGILQASRYLRVDAATSNHAGRRGTLETDAVGATIPVP